MQCSSTWWIGPSPYSLLALLRPCPIGFLGCWAEEGTECPHGGQVPGHHLGRRTVRPVVSIALGKATLWCGREGRAGGQEMGTPQMSGVS